ncbi:MAG TPA: hypothetical protein VHH34_16130 [Pseudonocardiaceae bacterium]|nr:hypothetical protein [Pseudonocardiaceae bacterium]
MRARSGIAAVVLALIGLFAAPAAPAQPPVTVVHTETADVGPYQMRVSFSEWPLRAQRSLDFLFVPEGGIAGLRGTLRMVGPSGTEFRPQLQSAGPEGRTLVRHPRARQAWGLDIVALPEEGVWRFEFALDGPRGPGTGTVTLPVGPRPGPPAAASWAVGLLPVAAAGVAATALWARGRRNGARPGPAAWTWS